MPTRDTQIKTKAQYELDRLAGIPLAASMATANLIKGVTDRTDGRIQSLEGEMAILIDQHSLAAYDALTLDTDEARMAAVQIKRKMEVIQDELDTLRAGREIAAKRRAEADKAIALAHAGEHFSKVRALIEARSPLAAKLSAAIEQAVATWKEITELQTRIAECVPAGFEFPHDIAMAFVQMRLAIARETARLSATPGYNDDASYPGSIAGFQHQGMPDQLEPLASVIARGDAWLLAHLAPKGVV